MRAMEVRKAVLGVVGPFENALHEQALLDEGRVDFHANDLVCAGAKHLQGVKAVVCTKIESSATVWNRHVLGQHMTPSQHSEIWIPNRAPPDSCARIEGRVCSVCGQPQLPQHLRCEQVCAE